jgi:DNA anti-recombination protein RmuC
MIMWGARSQAGPMAPPGSYQVRITAGGITKTSSFEIKRDPRLKGVTDEDLTAQFALASSIRDQESAAINAVIRIRALKAAIDDRAAKAPALGAAANSLKQKLTAVEDELYQGRSRSSQDLLNFPIRLSNRIAALRRSVESGDAKPTDGAHQVFKELSADLARQLAGLDGIVATDLENFNRQLAARKLDRVGGPK